jgi:hypothetical protein
MSPAPPPRMATDDQQLKDAGPQGQQHDRQPGPAAEGPQPGRQGGDQADGHGPVGGSLLLGETGRRRVAGLEAPDDLCRGGAGHVGVDAWTRQQRQT